MERLDGGLFPRGLGAGVLGTLALTGWEPLRDSLLGHPPPYSVRHIALNLARHWLGVRLDSRKAQRWGLVMRWVYGPVLGLIHARLRPWLPRGVWARGFALGMGVWLFESLSFPLLRVTPPPRTWSSAERRLLALQGLVFGFMTESVLSRWQADRLALECSQPPHLDPLPVGEGGSCATLGCTRHPPLSTLNR